MQPRLDKSRGTVQLKTITKYFPEIDWGDGDKP
jgi:hypothetical protein